MSRTLSWPCTLIWIATTHCKHHSNYNEESGYKHPVLDLNAKDAESLNNHLGHGEVSELGPLCAQKRTYRRAQRGFNSASVIPTFLT
jgi:hypothetical protein